MNMKKVFTILISMITVSVLFAQPAERSRPWNIDKCWLTVSAYGNANLKIMVDGNNYSTRGQDGEVMVNRIRPGYHNIKVYRQKKDRYSYDKGNYRDLQLIYDGKIYIRPQYHVDISVNRFGRAFVDERRVDRENNNGYEETGYDDSGWNDDRDQPMDSRVFSQWISTLKNESFDNTRLLLAKQNISQNHFTTMQVKEVMQLFAFENTKLDLAKYCYKYTVDRKNYFLLNDAFSFSSSREDLARYIQSYR